MAHCRGVPGYSWSLHWSRFPGFLLFGIGPFPGFLQSVGIPFVSEFCFDQIGNLNVNVLSDAVGKGGGGLDEAGVV